MLRQLGVGDLRIDRKVKNMAGIAQVWLMTYEAGFEDGDEALGKALSGTTFNPYAGPMTDIGVHVMTDYMRRLIGGVYHGCEI